MAYCTSCGNQLTEDSAFCEKCGKAVVGNAPQNEGYRYARPSQRTEVSKRPSITALVFSVVSLFTSLFCYIPFVFFVFSIISVIFIVVSRSNRKEHIRMAGEENGFTRAANICSIVAIPVASFFTILGIVFTAAILG